MDMKHALKTRGGKSRHTGSAKVVDGKLILAFPDALTPVLWQMDLEQAKASALEVRDNKEQGSFVLTLKTARGETTDIASFSGREDAVNGLMATAEALESAQGQIRPPQVAGTQVSYQESSPARKSSAGKWVAGILAVFMLLFLINIWGALMPRPEKITAANLGGPGQASANSDSAGVPVSADEYLNSTDPGK